MGFWGFGASSGKFPSLKTSKPQNFKTSKPQNPKLQAAFFIGLLRADQCFRGSQDA
jgi:hypothetical protein